MASRTIRLVERTPRRVRGTIRGRPTAGGRVSLAEGGGFIRALLQEGVQGRRWAMEPARWAMLEIPLDAGRLEGAGSSLRARLRSPMELRHICHFCRVTRGSAMGSFCRIGPCLEPLPAETPTRFPQVTGVSVRFWEWGWPWPVRTHTPGVPGARLLGWAWARVTASTRAGTKHVPGRGPTVRLVECTASSLL